eukprot:6180958-Pleurochrysis_carterae.AAC.2
MEPWKAFNGHRDCSPAPTVLHKRTHPKIRHLYVAMRASSKGNCPPPERCSTPSTAPSTDWPITTFTPEAPHFQVLRKRIEACAMGCDSVLVGTRCPGSVGELNWS